jgi:hypothetical protein
MRFTKNAVLFRIRGEKNYRKEEMSLALYVPALCILLLFHTKTIHCYIDSQDCGLG